MTTGLIKCDFKAYNQKPLKWAQALRDGICPKCGGKVKDFNPNLFFDTDSMSVYYRCLSCNRIYDWPHSYIATGKRGGCRVPIRIRPPFPPWLNPAYITAVEDWHERGGRDEKGRFASYPAGQEAKEA